MELPLSVLNLVLPVLYGALVFAYGYLLLRDSEPVRRLAPRVLGATVVLHFLYLLGEGLLLGRHPMADKFELFQFVALGIAAAYWWVEWRRDNPYTGVFPLTLAFLLQVCASLGRPRVVTVPPLLQDPLFAWHTGAAAFALSAFSVGAVYGGLFLIVYRLLKRGRFGRFTMRVPPLDVLANMSVHAGEVGLAALTLAVALGAAWARRYPEASLLDPKVLVTLAAWVVYAVALGGHLLARWGGWRVVSLTLAGYGMLLASLLTMGRVFSSFHHRFGG